MILFPLTIQSTFSLIKMLYWVVRKNCEAGDGQTGLYLTKRQLIQAVQRNFGGSDEFDPRDEFQDCLQSDTIVKVCVVVQLFYFLLYVFLTTWEYCPCLCMQQFCILL